MILWEGHRIQIDCHRMTSGGNHEAFANAIHIFATEMYDQVLRMGDIANIGCLKRLGLPRR